MKNNSGSMPGVATGSKYVLSLGISYSGIQGLCITTSDRKESVIVSAHVSLGTIVSVADLLDVCMAPSNLLSAEDRAIRKESFEQFRGTTHVPFAAIYSRPHEPKIREGGNPCPYDNGKPKNPPKLTKRLLQLVGKESY
ncbi:uncharacterized protein IL334_003741 [Kwoniella shivajii]|uniref:Uncharacterized protein n=1 Tax=Kwoniella shivajii TaxID=564305 RepID=A0ABZ1CYY1_9TREE|nr:hypothetical protein IL334_003741 [Kwoniella shivajii]